MLLETPGDQLSVFSQELHQLGRPVSDVKKYLKALNRGTLST